MLKLSEKDRIWDLKMFTIKQLSLWESKNYRQVSTFL